MGDKVDFGQNLGQKWSSSSPTFKKPCFKCAYLRASYSLLRRVMDVLYISGMFLDLPDQSNAIFLQISPRSIDWWHQTGLGGTRTYLIISNKHQLPDQPFISNKDRPNHPPSRTSQTSLMPPIDRSRRDLSIGGIRLVWEVKEHTDKVDFGLKIGLGGPPSFQTPRSQKWHLEVLKLLLRGDSFFRYVLVPPRPSDATNR